MARVKRGVTTHARHKKVIKRAKGYRSRGNNVFTVAIERVDRVARDDHLRRRELAEPLPAAADKAGVTVPAARSAAPGRDAEAQQRDRKPRLRVCVRPAVFSCASSARTTSSVSPTVRHFSAPAVAETLIPVC